MSNNKNTEIAELISAIESNVHNIPENLINENQDGLMPVVPLQYISEELEALKSNETNKELIQRDLIQGVLSDPYSLNEIKGINYSVSEIRRLIEFLNGKDRALKEDWNNKFSEKILLENENDNFRQIISAFDITAFAFYIYRSEREFVEYCSFESNGTTVLEVPLNHSENGIGLLNNTAYDIESLWFELEYFSWGVTQEDDDKLDAFIEDTNSSNFDEFVAYIRELESIALQNEAYIEY